MLVTDKTLYPKVEKLISQDCPELSVASVLLGILPGQVFVDCLEHPSSVLVRTSECNYLAGSPDNEAFNAEIQANLDFWDPVVLDSDTWEAHIPEFHPNPHIRKYQRLQYILTDSDYKAIDSELPQGYELISVNPKQVTEGSLDSKDKILDWIGGWGSPENFQAHGVGYYIKHQDSIVSCSLADCFANGAMAIGVQTDPEHRRRGLGLIVTGATVAAALGRGCREVQWLCVASNAGSIAIAKGLGFTLRRPYYAFSPYPPIETETDLSKEQWRDWATYFKETGSSRLLFEEANCWAKAGDVEGVISALLRLTPTLEKGLDSEKIAVYPTFQRFQTDPHWQNFLESLG